MQVSAVCFCLPKLSPALMEVVEGIGQEWARQGVIHLS
jgi:hypothetical protein